MSTPLVIVGIGGFGRETLGVVDALAGEYDVLGFVDDAPAPLNVERLERLGHRVLGGSEWLAGASTDVRYVISINAPEARRRLADRFGERPAATLVHPTAVLGRDVHVGEGSVVCAGASLTTNIRLGRHVHVNPMCTIGHDVVLEDFVSLNHAVAVSGEVTVGTGSVLGTHATVLQGLKISPDAVVGASACVVRDVSAGATVKGVPAK